MITKQGTFNKPIFQLTLLPATCQSESNGGHYYRNSTVFYNTVESLISGHLWNMKRVSATGAGHLQEGFWKEATRVVRCIWPLHCPTSNKHRDLQKIPLFQTFLFCFSS